MTQYIPKEPLLAEMKRRILEDYNTEDEEKDAVAQGAIASLKYYIEDTLEVKEVNLDCIKKELDELIRIHKPNGDFGWGTLYNVATHFFELGLKAAQKGE